MSSLLNRYKPWKYSGGEEMEENTRRTDEVEAKEIVRWLSNRITELEGKVEGGKRMHEILSEGFTNLAERVGRLEKHEFENKAGELRTWVSNRVPQREYDSKGATFVSRKVIELEGRMNELEDELGEEDMCCQRDEVAIGQDEALYGEESGKEIRIRLVDISKKPLRGNWKDVSLCPSCKTFDICEICRGLSKIRPWGFETRVEYCLYYIEK